MGWFSNLMGHSTPAPEPVEPTNAEAEQAILEIEVILKDRLGMESIDITDVIDGIRIELRGPKIKVPDGSKRPRVEDMTKINSLLNQILEQERDPK